MQIPSRTGLAEQPSAVPGSVGMRIRKTRRRAILVVLALLTTACGEDLTTSTVTSDETVELRRGGWPSDLFDPTQTGEDLPEDYRESVPRDAINPVYDPRFVGRQDVTWPDDELVIGVVIDGEARAYPVGFLTWREIVIDTHRGIPTMVTW